MQLRITFSALVVLCCLSLTSQQLSIVHDPAKEFVELGADRITLRKDLPLVVSSMQVTSSETDTVGDVVTFEVIRPVMAGTLVVIPKGALAKAIVTQLHAAGRLGKSGQLELTFSTVQLVTGETAPLKGHIVSEGGSKFRQDAGDWGLIGATGLFLFGEGAESSIPVGLHLPASLKQDFTLSRASVEARQPAPTHPRTDVGYIYIFRDAEPGSPYFPIGFKCGEKLYSLMPDTAIGIELPPGSYWLRVGARLNKRLSKLKAADATRITIKGGDSYFITYKVEKRDLAISMIEPEAGEDHVIGTEMLWNYPLATETPQTLEQLKAQPRAP